GGFAQESRAMASPFPGLKRGISLPQAIRMGGAMRTVRLVLAALPLLIVACATQSIEPVPDAGGGPTKPKVDRIIMAVAPPMLESNEMRHLVGPTSWQLRPMYESLIGIDP